LVAGSIVFFGVCVRSDTSAMDASNELAGQDPDPEPVRGARAGRALIAVAVAAPLLALAAVAVVWPWLATPQVKIVGDGPMGQVEVSESEGEWPGERKMTLVGDGGGVAVLVRNESRFPATLEPQDATSEGFRVHVGRSPTVDGYMMPTGSTELTRALVEAPPEAVTLAPGELGWVSLTTWFPLECRALTGSPDAPVQREEVWDEAWEYSVAPLRVTVLGRSSNVSLEVPSVVVPVNSSSGDFQRCGTFAP
jgi:hypothetical protein